MPFLQTDPKEVFGDCQLLRLRELGFVILFTTQRHIFFARRDAKFRTNSPDGLIAGLVLDLDIRMRKFVALVGDSREFSMDQFATLLGMSRQNIRLWQNEGVIHPSIRNGSHANGAPRIKRLFNHVDLFVGGVIRTMRKNGVPLTLVLKASRTLYRWLESPASDVDATIEREEMCHV